MGIFRKKQEYKKANVMTSLPNLPPIPQYNPGEDDSIIDEKEMLQAQQQVQSAQRLPQPVQQTNRNEIEELKQRLRAAEEEQQKQQVEQVKPKEYSATEKLDIIQSNAARLYEQIVALRQTEGV